MAKVEIKIGEALRALENLRDGVDFAINMVGSVAATDQSIVMEVEDLPLPKGGFPVCGDPPCVLREPAQIRDTATFLGSAGTDAQKLLLAVMENDSAKSIIEAGGTKFWYTRQPVSEAEESSN